MKKYRNDIILILIIVVISIITLIALNINSSKNNLKVCIYSSDELVYEVYLDEIEDEKVVEIDGKISTMKILLTNDSACVITSDCHDHICINQGEIHNTSQTISCLPNEVYITLISDEGVDSII